MGDMFIPNSSPNDGIQELNLTLHHVRDGSSSLQEHQWQEFRRLARILVFGPPFQYVFAVVGAESERENVIEALDAVFKASGVSARRFEYREGESIGHTAESYDECDNRTEKFRRASARVQDLQRQIAAATSELQPQVLHIALPREFWSPQVFDAFNIRRENIARECAGHRLLFWLAPDVISDLARYAPDVWSWRSGSYDFSAQSRS
jgi:hypothetical protein